IAVSFTSLVGRCQASPHTVLRGAPVLQELVLEGVGQRQPARLDHVLRDADGAPDVLVVLALNDYAHPRRRPRTGVDRPDLVIDQMHLLKAGEVAFERLPQGAVEGVDGAVPLADGVLRSVADLQLDRRLRRGVVPRAGPPADAHVETADVEAGTI